MADSFIKVASDDLRNRRQSSPPSTGPGRPPVGFFRAGTHTRTTPRHRVKELPWSTYKEGCPPRFYPSKVTSLAAIAARALEYMAQEAAERSEEDEGGGAEELGAESLGETHPQDFVQRVRQLISSQAQQVSLDMLETAGRKRKDVRSETPPEEHRGAKRVRFAEPLEIGPSRTEEETPAASAQAKPLRSAMAQKRGLKPQRDQTRAVSQSNRSFTTRIERSASGSTVPAGSSRDQYLHSPDFFWEDV